MRGNKLIIFISLMLVTGVVIGLLIPNPGHDSNFVEFSLGGPKMTLQQAINDERFLISLPASVIAVKPQNNSHAAKDIWVSINGVERTLEDSLKMNKGLCGNSVVAYSGKKDPGHLASEIKITIDDNEMTFQNAINVGKFCAKWTPSAWGGCSASCGGGTQTRTVSCTRGDGTPLNEIYCTDPKPALSQACNTQSCCNPYTITRDASTQGDGTPSRDCNWYCGTFGESCISAVADATGVEDAVWLTKYTCDYWIRKVGDYAKWSGPDTCAFGDGIAKCQKIATVSHICYCQKTC